MVNSTRTPAELHRDTIKHLRWQAKAVANLLSAVHLLPPGDQQTTIDTASLLAVEMSTELDALTRGAA